MRSKFIIAILAIATAVVAYLIISPILNKKEIKKETSQKQNDNEVSLEKTTQYKDPAGFSFKYPSALLMEKKEATDEAVYTDIIITSPNNKGNIEIDVISFENDTIEFDKGFTKPKEASLAGIKAQESESKKSIELKAIDTGVLFTIALNHEGEKNFWLPVYSGILKSFTLALPEEETAPVYDSGETSSDIEFEGEEIIE